MKRISKGGRAIWVALAVLAAVLPGPPATAEESAKPPPLAGYRPEDRREAEDILKDVTFKADRRMTFPADEDVLRFLVDHPDFAADVSRGIGHERFRVRREKGRYRITHGYARGIFRVVERRPDRVAYLAAGTYDRPVLRLLGIRLRARAFVVETFGRASAPRPGGAPPDRTVTIRAYLHVENPILGKIFRWVGPLIRTAFERKLTGAYRIAPELSRMAYEGAESFLKKVRKIEGLDAVQLGRFEALVKRQPVRKMSSN
ncbi:MAG: hypothetical protein ACE5IM_06645 [Nitrospinota bacterium]